ncbi:MAG: response regulator [Clostridia bacterium]|nr:response regulator [Clostridia bacterium]
MLLIDDEPSVLEGLKIMVDWGRYGFSICGEATNGEDALEIIKACNPHLVITDIRMPAMDGLQLIKTVSQSAMICSKFIILSGYDEFSYIQAAMRYSVSDYILKPLDDEELNTVINRVAKQLREAYLSEEATNQQLAFIINNDVYRIIHGEKKQSLYKRIKFILDIGDEEAIQCVLIELDHPARDSRDAERVEVLERKKRISSAIKDVLGLRNVLHLFEDNEGRFFILANKGMKGAFSLETCIQQIREKIMNEFRSSISVAISDEVKGIESLQKVYEQASLALKYKFFKGEDSTINYKEVRGTPLCYDLCDIDASGMREDIRNGNMEGLHRKIDQVFSSFSKSFTAPETVKMFVNNLQFEGIQLVRSRNGSMEGLSEELLEFNQDMESTTLAKLKKGCLQFCKRLIEKFEQSPQETTKDVISEIKQYILLHYSEDLKLQELAKQFYLNPVYLGQLFKKNTGMSFNEYLHFVRIGEAKKLLQRTPMKMNEIAQTVGYHDAEYFTAKFKAITKCLPSDYKRNWAGQKATPVIKDKSI